MRIITDWFRRNFSNPQVVYLALFIIVIFAVVLFMGKTLTPVLASIVIAYLLEGIIRVLIKSKIPRFISVLLVFAGFMVFVLVILFVLLPLLSKQVTQLVAQIPSMFSATQASIMTLPERYPDFLSVEQVGELMTSIRYELTGLGQRAVSVSVSSVVDVITLLVYVILLPILVFFFLKDKDRILDWVGGFLPSDYTLTKQVWADVDLQIGNYIRGKFWEILIVFAVTFATFQWFGLDYAMLLAVAVGLSVIIPYVGAAVVTLPVVLIAWFQLGASSDFWWVVGSYMVIQALDGNVLVPLLFSEVVNLHPVAIIVAVLVFGGLWGFWGVFFAIPLATVVQAIITAWPHDTHDPPIDRAKAA